MLGGELTEAIGEAACGGIERAKDGAVRRRYLFAEGFPGFRGHFPGRPVLPAAVQVMVASLLVADGAGRSALPVSIERAKFTAPIAPGVPVLVVCRPRRGCPDVWEVSIDAGGKAAATFALELRAPAPAA